jgi:DNA polymerase-3 subunit epsilon
MRYIFLDTETTGLNPAQGDRLVEIGCIEMLERSLTENVFHLYFNPERDMPIEAFNVHGLSREFLSDKPLFKEKAKELIDFIQDSTLIIHNASFDISFLNAELEAVGLNPISYYVKEVVDSLKEARIMYPGKKNSLDALCDRLEIDRSVRNYHGALVDCKLLAGVWLAMTRGQDELFSYTNYDLEKNSSNSSMNSINIDIEDTGIIILCLN